MSTALPLVVLAVTALLYWRGCLRLVGARHRRDQHERAWAFYAGLAVLAVATGPQVDRLADRLFWGHMVQHSLLQMVAPPLIVVGAPWLPFWRLLPHRARRGAGRWYFCSPGARPVRSAVHLLARPTVAWLLFLSAIWLSHLPRVFDFALEHGAFHAGEHIVFVLLGVLFWSRAIDSPPFRARLAPLRAAGYFLAATVAESALALLILAAHHPLYSGYAALTPRPDGMSALADQQFGAAFMLEPASLPLLLAIIWAIKRRYEEGRPGRLEPVGPTP